MSWPEALRIAKHPESRVPMATFSQIARTLHGYSTLYNLQSDFMTCIKNNCFNSRFLIN